MPRSKTGAPLPWLIAEALETMKVSFQIHMPIPFVQWMTAASISIYCRCICLSQTITFTLF